MQMSDVEVWVERTSRTRTRCQIIGTQSAWTRNVAGIDQSMLISSRSRSTSSLLPFSSSKAAPFVCAQLLLWHGYFLWDKDSTDRANQSQTLVIMKLSNIPPYILFNEFETGRATSSASSSLLLPIQARVSSSGTSTWYGQRVPTRSASMPPLGTVSSKFCFYEPGVAVSIARIARCVIKPFLVCPYRNAGASALPMVTPCP